MAWIEVDIYILGRVEVLGTFSSSLNTNTVEVKLKTNVNILARLGHCITYLHILSPLFDWSI